ncbi:MAG: class I SAM-dependent methyltransferase [Marmoricola sp.]
MSRGSGVVPDPAFSNPRLASLYDAMEADRSDLDAYVGMIEEFSSRRVLDIGCGTGTLAVLLARRGIEVTGLDPASASLDVARSKPGAERVTWLHEDATGLSPMQLDLALMTGNVAQVFLSDQDWDATLAGVHTALRPGGRLVFETRVPAAQAWLGWVPALSRRRTKIPGVGAVESWVDVTDVGPRLVSFRSTYRFEEGGAVLHSDSTLRFRNEEEVADSLHRAGYTVLDVRGAADRPGKELVFVAQRPEDR